MKQERTYRTTAQRIKNGALCVAVVLTTGLIAWSVEQKIPNESERSTDQSHPIR